jgi:dolichyl-phosphate-mannose-protein mannosyltransferase
MLQRGVERLMAAPAEAVPTTGPADETVVIRIGPGRDWAAYGVAIAAALLSAGATYYFLSHHMILGFRDAYAHLEISRRVMVGKTVGIAQLGGIWLPLPHVLQSLFAWNWTLYRTGLAGSFVSMAAYVGSSVLVYKIVKVLVGKRAWPAVAGAAVFMTNPNLLYQQSTPMDELPLYVFTLGAIYALLRWGATKRATYVLAAGICSMLAMLCRYEAWFLGLIYVFCVVLMARRMGLSWRDTRGLALVSVLFGFVISISGWLIYNWLIFGSPLNFLYGANSSADQMASQQTEMEIHNWPLTLRAYGTAITANLGLVELGLAGLALILFLARERISAKSLPVISLILVLPFYVYTLESGQEPIGTPTLNGGLTNFRFGLIALLPASILIGYLVGALPRKLRAPIAIVAVVAVAGTSGLSFYRHQIVLETEAAENQTAQVLPVATGDYLQKHTQGSVLIDVVRNELVAFPVLDRTVYSGTRDAHGSLWTRSLADPESAGIDVIVMRTMPTDEDQVYKALFNSPELKPYRETYHNAQYAVFVLR